MFFCNQQCFPISEALVIGRRVAAKLIFDYFCDRTVDLPAKLQEERGISVKVLIPPEHFAVEKS